MKKMFKTEPFKSDRPWGYELWTLSTHRSGQSLVLPSHEKLEDYLGHPLPILIKIIKADEALSVQVHPGDEYAQEHENDNGKTECWYILDAKPGAYLIAGIKKGLNRCKMEEIIDEGRLEDVLLELPVKKGDMVYIPHGTVHAIMGGIKLFEVQQSSDSTYRMYDWGRDREMHIEKSLDVIDYACCNGAGKIKNFETLETPYFNVQKVDVTPDSPAEFDVHEQFQTINICHGSGLVRSQYETIEFKEDETIYIPRDTHYVVEGDCQLLRTY